jgi:putative toxin-antitoxin system antitoxin component (TIGR02293 family)
MKAKPYPIKEKELDVLNDPKILTYSNQYYNMAYSGISKNYIKQILHKSKLTLDELMQIIPVSIDTYKRKSTFKPPVTEKVLEIQEVYSKGLAAFGESFYDWMDTSNTALGNIPPKQLLRNSFGIRILLDEIGRLEHGILA